MGDEETEKKQALRVANSRDKGGIVKCLWRGQHEVLSAFVGGEVWLQNVSEEDSQVMLFKGDSAVRDMLLMGQQLVLALDCGKVILIDLTTKSPVLLQVNHFNFRK